MALGSHFWLNEIFRQSLRIGGIKVRNGWPRFIWKQVSPLFPIIIISPPLSAQNCNILPSPHLTSTHFQAALLDNLMNIGVIFVYELRVLKILFLTSKYITLP